MSDVEWETQVSLGKVHGSDVRSKTIEEYLAKGKNCKS